MGLGVVHPSPSRAEGLSAQIGDFAWAPAFHAGTMAAQFRASDLILAPTRYSSDAVRVLRLRFERVIPEAGLMKKARRLSLSPYVLAARNSMVVGDGRHVGRDIPGEEKVQVLHIGGGTELHATEQLSLAFDFASVLHDGSLSGSNYQTYRLGVNFEF